MDSDIEAEYVIFYCYTLANSFVIRKEQRKSMYDGILIDTLILGILLVGTTTGFTRGILREVLSLSLWLLIAIVALAHAESLSAWLSSLVVDPLMRGWLIALTVVLLAASLLTVVDLMLRNVLVKAGRAAQDPLLGLLFGAGRALLVVTAVVVLIHRTDLPDRLAWHQSQLVGYAEALALGLRNHLPEDVAQHIVLRGRGVAKRRVVLPRDRRGHFIGRAWINGMPVEVLVDTGATMVMIPAHLSDRLLLTPAEHFPVNTASGRVTAQHTTLDAIKLGPLLLHDVDAALVPSPKDTVLIGMSFLLQTRFQHTSDGLLIEQARPGLAALP